MTMINKIKADAIVIGCILITALLFFGMIYLREPTDGEVMIIRDGELMGCYELSAEETISVSDQEGGFNLVLISNGTVRVCDANCPDKLCIRQKSISKNGESIICLPHKLVVQIVSKEESDLDAVTN